MSFNIYKIIFIDKSKKLQEKIINSDVEQNAKSLVTFGEKT